MTVNFVTDIAIIMQSRAVLLPG